MPCYFGKKRAPVGHAIDKS